MNAASQWRYAFARGVAPVYAANPHVAAVILGGSTARGHADRYSDIELGVFWHRPPTDPERQAAAGAIDGDLHRLYPYDPVEEVWSDDYFLGRASRERPKSGVLLEVGHHTVDFAERTFDAVLRRHDADAEKQNFVSSIVDSVPLFNTGLVQEWKAHAAVYPYDLTLAVVRRYAQIDHFWRSEMWLARGENLMMLYESFVRAQKKVLHVLLGLNKIYYFKFKWLGVVVGRLEHKPPDLVARLRRIYQVPPAAGAREVATLVEETYDLIERQLPEIDADWLRAVFRYRRPQWEQAPPITNGLAGK